MSFISPYEERETISLNRYSDSDMYHLNEEMDLETVWDRLPDEWLKRIKKFHTDIREMQQTITTSSLLNHMQDEEHWRKVFRELSKKSVKQVRRVLRNTGDLSPVALRQAFVGHSNDQFRLTPTNSGWSLHLLHLSGALYIRMLDDESVEEFVPGPLRTILETIVSNPPDSEHEFPVPPEKQLRLELPPKSYYENLPDTITQIKKMTKNKTSSEHLVNAAESLMKDAFKLFMLFTSVVGAKNINFRTLEKPIQTLVNELKNSEAGAVFADLLEKYLFFGPSQTEFIVGKDLDGELHCRFWQEFQPHFSDIPGVHSGLFCLGKFRTTPIMGDQFTFNERLGLLIPLIFSHSENPAQQCLEWIHSSQQSNRKVNQSLPLGVLRWVNSRPEQLDREQALDILDEGTQHRRSGIRRTAFRIMRDLYPEKFKEERHRALEDDAKKVREWAQNQDQETLF